MIAGDDAGDDARDDDAQMTRLNQRGTSQAGNDNNNVVMLIFNETIYEINDNGDNGEI